MRNPDWDKFDYWLKLAKEDPEKYEDEKIKCIHYKIDNIYCSNNPEKAKRLKAFLWRAQQELRHYVDPIARTTQAMKMMWDSAERFRNEIKK